MNSILLWSIYNSWNWLKKCSKTRIIFHSSSISKEFGVSVSLICFPSCRNLIVEINSPRRISYPNQSWYAFIILPNCAFWIIQNTTRSSQSRRLLTHYSFMTSWSSSLIGQFHKALWLAGYHLFVIWYPGAHQSESPEASWTSSELDLAWPRSLLDHVTRAD